MNQTDKLKEIENWEMEELTYTMVNGYYFPNLFIPKQPEWDPEISKTSPYIKARLNYLETMDHFQLHSLLLNNQLSTHLQETVLQAEEMESTLIKQMKKQENVTEELKAKDQMLWVQKMNMIKQQAQEIVMADLIRN